MSSDNHKPYKVNLLLCTSLRWLPTPGDQGLLGLLLFLHTCSVPVLCTPHRQYMLAKQADSTVSLSFYLQALALDCVDFFKIWAYALEKPHVKARKHNLQQPVAPLCSFWVHHYDFQQTQKVLQSKTNMTLSILRNSAEVDKNPSVW